MYDKPPVLVPRRRTGEVREQVALEIDPLAHLADAAKSFGHQERGLGPLALQERVGPDRRAVAEESDVLCTNAVAEQRFDAAQNGTRRIIGRRRELGDRDRAGVLIEAYEIRERTPGVDRHSDLPHRRSPV